jgi:hypothetical protein
LTGKSILLFLIIAGELTLTGNAAHISSKKSVNRPPRAIPIPLLDEQFFTAKTISEKLFMK